MIDTQRLQKVSMIWVSVVYVICYLAIALFPDLRSWFAENALHMESGLISQSVISAGTFVWGLIIWNIITLLALWLFSSLYNKIK